MVSTYQHCNELLTCPGCSQPLTKCQLGLAPVSATLIRISRYRKWMDYMFEAAVLIHISWPVQQQESLNFVHTLYVVTIVEGGQKKRHKDNTNRLDHKTWEDMAKKNRATWRNLLCEGGALYNDDPHHAAEHNCARIIGSRISLYSHLKTQWDQEAQLYSTMMMLYQVSEKEGQCWSDTFGHKVLKCHMMPHSK